VSLIRFNLTKGVLPMASAMWFKILPILIPPIHINLLGFNRILASQQLPVNSTIVPFLGFFNKMTAVF
jgi:hypothetical protein